MFRCEPTEEDFRDEGGFKIVGGRCSHATCNVHDYLPFPCRHCSAIFCAKHVEPKDHDCPDIPDTKGMLAVQCPKCQATVRYVSADSSEEQALEAHKPACKVLAKPKKERCPVQGCKETLGFTSTFACPKCKQRVCMTHRFEDAHGCSEAKSGWLGRLAGPAAEPRSAPGAGAPAARAVTTVAAPLGSAVPQQFSADGQAPPAAAARAAWLDKMAPAKEAEAGKHSALASGEALRALRSQLGGTSAANQTCLETVRRLLRNVSSDPGSAKFRTVKCDNAAIQDRVLNVPGGRELLLGIGFEDHGSTLELPSRVGKGRVDAVLTLLE